MFSNLVPPAGANIFEYIGPYRVAELMAKGGAGRVFRCAHRVSGQTAAVKVPLGASVYEREALRRETVLLERLSHLDYPSVVRLVESGNDSGNPWYAMEYIQGQHLASFCDKLWGNFGAASAPVQTLTDDQSGEREPSGSVDDDPVAATQTLASPVWLDGSDAGMEARITVPPPSTLPLVAGGQLTEVLRIGACLADALDLIHSEGVVHGDLSPRNVIIRATTLEPVLVDFGTSFLAFRAGLGRELMHVVGRPQGTPAYMAPEAIEGRPLDARCDLYALGCILFELLAGRRVFRGPDSAAILSQHRFALPPKIVDFVVNLPPLVGEMITRLLAKDPSARVGRAREVAAILRSVMGEAPRLAEPIADRNPLLFRPRLCERHVVLESICQNLPTTLAPSGGLILVSGESGAGKTRLVNEVAARARAQGMVVFSGQCTDNGVETMTGMRASAALHPFEPILQQVADRCLVDSDRDWRTEFAEQLGVLAPYAPSIIGPLVESQDPDALSPELGRKRVLRSLQELIVAMGSEQPLLLVLDDLQWADELTLGFLRENAPKLAGSQVVLLATYRREQASEELTGLAEGALEEHLLGRLSAAGVHNFAKDMLGTDNIPEGLSGFLLRHSEGNPFFAAEYIRAALGRGLLRYRGTGEWEFDSAPNVEIPRSLGALFELRLAALSPKATTLLQLAAILGREFELSLLQTLPGADGRVDEAALEELVAAEILEWVGPQRYRFAHSKLREAQAEALSAEARRRLHRSVALRLESLRDQRGDSGHSEALGVHWAAAGEPEQALPHLEWAAKAAEERYARGRATELYREAILQCQELQQHAPARFRRRLCQLEESMGDSLIMQAQHGEARAAFDRALALTQTGEHLHRARVLRKKAASHWVLHDYEKAEHLLDFAEKALGNPGAEQSLEIQERIEILVGRLEVLYFAGKIGERTFALLTEIEPLVTRYGTPLQRHSYFVAACSELFARGRFAFDEKVLALARQSLPRKEGELPLNLAAQAHFAVGLCQLSGSVQSCQEAVWWLRRADELAEKSGDSTMTCRILVYLTLALLRIGDVGGTRAMADRVLFAAETAQLTPYIAIGAAFEAWVHWKRDELTEARARAEKAQEIWAAHSHPFPFKWAALLPLFEMQITECALEPAARTLRELLGPTQQLLPASLTAALQSGLEACERRDERAAQEAALEAMAVAEVLGYC